MLWTFESMSLSSLRGMMPMSRRRATSPYEAAEHFLFKWVPVLESVLQSGPPDARYAVDRKELNTFLTVPLLDWQSLNPVHEVRAGPAPR
jgi:hypothetical protein